jgi:hypothetical protein
VLRKTLAILTAVILFGLSFTFSSCKDCGKIDTSSATSDPSDPSDPNNPNPDSDIDALSEVDLTEIAEHLLSRGAGDVEIEAMRHIATEHFGEDIGCVVLENGHYYYKDSKKNHDGPQTPNNCGIYALKRLLFVLGKKGIIDKNLWYEHTDQELRAFLFEPQQGQRPLFYEHGVLIPEAVLTLIHKFAGNTSKYSWVYDRFNKRIAKIPPPQFHADEEAAQVAEIEKEVRPLEEEAAEAQRIAEDEEKNVMQSSASK